MCACELCLSSKYGLSELSSEYTLETRLLKKVSLRHQYQEYSKDYEIQESLEIGDLVSNDQIVAIAAENSSSDTVWFVYVSEVKYVDHSSNNTVNYGHNVPKSQMIIKKVLYIKEEKNVFLYKESILYPLVEFEPNYNKKDDLSFFSNRIMFNLQKWVYYFSHNCFS